MSSPTQPQGEGSSVALLVDLITNTLDPGYAAAAARTEASGVRRRPGLDRGLVAIGSLLVGFTLVLGYVATHRAAPETAKVHSALVGRVRSAQASADHLDATAQRLAATINGLRNQALGGAGALRTQLQSEQLLAGATAVTGPGIIVELGNPPAASSSPANGRAGTTPIAAAQVLTDRDVRSVVNELWTDGAEAISVNDVRLTPTSAIRFAGEAVLVDFQPITAPYSIRAIGNANNLDTGFAASAVASRYQTLSGVRGVSFSFDERDRLELPASAISNPVHAHAVSSGASPTAAPSTGASK
jgi:uncharacterized protein YlxW (UPF0749 family)